MIQIRRDDGFSSSSRSFTDTRASLHGLKSDAMIREITSMIRMAKIVIETGFCDTSEIVSRSKEEIDDDAEGNIVSLVYRVEMKRATFLYE